MTETLSGLQFLCTNVFGGSSTKETEEAPPPKAGDGAPPKAGDGAGALAPPTTNKLLPGAAARLLKPPCIAWEGARLNVLVLKGCCVGRAKIEFPGNFDQSESELKAPAANIPENKNKS